VDDDDDSRDVKASGSEHDHEVTVGLKVHRFSLLRLALRAGPKSGAHLVFAALSDCSAALRPSSRPLRQSRRRGPT
jgi:hypothetical protein